MIVEFQAILQEGPLKFMNFSRKSAPGVVRIGCVFGDSCFDVTKAIGDDLLQFPRVVFTLEEVLHVKDGLDTLESQLGGLKRSSSGIQSYLFDLSTLDFHAPIIRPLKLIGIGLNYKDHAEEVKLPAPKQPLIFGMYSNAIVAHEHPIVIPPMSKQVDYEAELGVVIGRRARNVSTRNALPFIAGYTIINDVSARDLQFSDGQWLRAKSFDTFAPMGPFLVTREELGDAGNLGIQMRLNGRTMQNSNTQNLIFKVPDLVSYLSEVMTLEVGDVIATGTPAGVGFARNPQVFMQPGDIAEVEIEGIGILRNPVAAAD
jgi:2-keto-4-pentenoate hydratase/2-oxohepta-3-ene-1,7-dioic acid hydratase in catechol pathway